MPEEISEPPKCTGKCLWDGVLIRMCITCGKMDDEDYTDGTITAYDK